MNCVAAWHGHTELRAAALRKAVWWGMLLASLLRHLSYFTPFTFFGSYVFVVWRWNYTIRRERRLVKLECGPMPNVMAAVPNIGCALCSMPQSLADAHY